jgi:hypothetical protein
MASELYGKIGRSNLLHRLAELERRLTDHSCLAPHSPEWLAFWDRQLYNHMTDQECIPLTVEAMRAMIDEQLDAWVESFPVEVLSN